MCVTTTSSICGLSKDSMISAPIDRHVEVTRGLLDHDSLLRSEYVVGYNKVLDKQTPTCHCRFRLWGEHLAIAVPLGF